MSDFDPGRLYLLTHADETYLVTYHSHARKFRTLDRDLGWSDHLLWREANEDGVRPAIVLDPQDEDVQAFVKRYAPAASENYGVGRLAAQIAAQITPPKPVMAEPKWIGERVEDDRGVWVLTGHAYEAGPWFRITIAPARDEIPERSHWAGMVNPRAYEGVRDGE